MRLALAHTERQSRYELHDVATTARRGRDGFVLDGRKSVVPNADSAGLIVVIARVSGVRRDDHGIGLFVVPADAQGVTIEAYPTQDGGRAAEVAFANVTIGADAILGDPEDGLKLLVRVAEHGIAALAAEALGSMSALHFKRLAMVEYQLGDELRHLRRVADDGGLIAACSRSQSRCQGRRL